MSWNPQPTIGIASWAGNAQLVTKPQLYSTTQGLVNDINDLNISTISQVSTITATQWISTPVLYVSSIVGVDLTLSSFVSTNTATTNILNTSSISMKGFDSLFDIDVSFDFGLGKAIGGVVGGLGAAVGGGLIAVGTGAGLAIQGAEAGIATMVAPRGDNFINNTTFETINFTTQLQFSTLGNLYPFYSSILRTVSTSGQANTVPGSTIFTSTIFPAGTACVRSISDPFNLIGDSNLASSTIQAFGQWCPLIGLEPDNVVANNISANVISVGTLFAGVETTGEIVFPSTLSNASLGRVTGGVGGRITAAFGNMYIQPSTNLYFTQPYTGNYNAYMYLSTDSNYADFGISSIHVNSIVGSNSLKISSIICDELQVLSSFLILSTQIENILSTTVLNADTAIISSISTLQFNTGFGNPLGTFDIYKYEAIVSSSYNAVSSLTNNIMYYQMAAVVQDENVYDLAAYAPPTGVNFIMSPQNVNTWGSTIMLFNDYQNVGDILLDGPDVFSTSYLQGTFDASVQLNPVQGGVNSFYVQQRSYGSNGYDPKVSTLWFIDNSQTGANTGSLRFEIFADGYCRPTIPNPTPYATSNDNVFVINQDINDLNIATTDNMNFTAGAYKFAGGGTSFGGPVNVADIYNNYLDTSTIITNNLQTFKSDPNPAITNSFIVTEYLSSSLSTPTISNYNLVTSIYSTTVAHNSITQIFGTSTDITLGPLGRYSYNSIVNPNINWALGTLFVDLPNVTTDIFFDYNGFGLNSTLQVLNMVNPSPYYTLVHYSTLTTPNATYTLNANSSNSWWWSTGFGYVPSTFQAWPNLTYQDSVQMLQGYQNFTISSINTNITSNLNVQQANLSNTLFKGSVRSLQSGVPRQMAIVPYSDPTISWSYDSATVTYYSAAQNIIPGSFPVADYQCMTAWTDFNAPAGVTGLVSFALQTSNVGGYWYVYRFIRVTAAYSPSGGEIIYTNLLIPNNFTQ